MNDDAELLRQYADQRSEAAFAGLVRRHLGLVYHAALRQTGGDAHRAQDVAQEVFTSLARKARELSQRPTLAGWLHTSTRYAALQSVRTERRRQNREQEIYAMTDSLHPDTSGADWERLKPFVDEALHSLGERDREAVLLRFFEGRPFAEVGAKLAVSEDAARVRVDRALEKLRATLARHGVTSTAAALSVALAAQAGAAVPAGLAATVTSGALVSGAAPALILTLMNLSKIKVVLVLGAVAAGATTVMVQHQGKTALRAEVAQLSGPTPDPMIVDGAQSSGPLVSAQPAVNVVPLPGASKSRSQLARLMEDPSLREYTTRRITLDYAAFASMIGLSKEATELFIRTLVDQNTAIDADEYKSYDGLLSEIIGEENFIKLKTFKAELPLKEQAAAGVESLKQAHPSIKPDRLNSVSTALMNVPVNNDLFKAIQVQPRISDADVAAAESSFRTSYALAISRIDPPLSPAEITTLDAWYERQLAIQMGFLKRQQVMTNNNK